MKSYNISPVTPWAVKINGAAGKVGISRVRIVRQPGKQKPGVCEVCRGHQFQWTGAVSAKFIWKLCGQPEYVIGVPPEPCWVLVDDQYAAIRVEMRKGGNIP